MNERTPELNYQEFVRARKQFRGPGIAQAATPSGGDDDIMLYSAGPDPFFAVFEQSQGAGSFYLFDAKQKRILKASRIYDRASVAVEEDIVDIGWAADDSACGLALWGEFRAFLGVSNNLESCKPMMHADEDGIPSTEWPAGFEHYFEPKID